MAQPTVTTPPGMDQPPGDTDFLRWRIEELEHNERRLRALVEYSADIITLVAPIGTILYQSPSVSRVLGYGHTELVGSNLFAHVHARDVPAGMEHWSALSQTPGRVAPLHCRFRHKDGTYRWMEGIGGNLTNEPAVQAIVLNLRDVTESRRAEDRAARVSRDLQRQASSLRRLPRAIRLLSEAEDVLAVLSIVVREARALRGVLGAAVFIRDGDAGALRLAEIQPPADDASGEVSFDGIVAQCAYTKLPAEATDSGDFGSDIDPMFALWRGDQPRRALAVPLLSSGRTQGVLAIVSAQARPFAEHEQNALTSLAETASANLTRLRLLAAEDTRRQALIVSRETAELLAASPDGDSAIGAVLAEVARFASADAALLALVGAGGLELNHCHCTSQVAERSLDSARNALPIGQILCGMLAAEREIVIDDAQKCLELQLPDALTPFRSLLWNPIRTDGLPAHWICLAKVAPGGFEKEAAECARAAARQIELAITRTAVIGGLRAEAARAQALSHRLVEVQEIERTRIAREIHDAAGQSLTSILLDLHRLDAEGALPDAQRPLLAAVHQQVGAVLDGLHQLATNLRPPALDHAGLVASVRQMANAFQAQSGVAVRFETVGLDAERMAPETETALYRIVQEALTNVARHARASRVDVILERRSDELVAVVEDDGSGFDADAMSENGRLGLVGMRERASMLDGRLMIESAPGRGTTIQTTVPLPTIGERLPNTTDDAERR